jgi:hypothetical protein
VDFEGAEPGELLRRIGTLLPNQVEVHVPPVNFSVTCAGQQELVDWVDRYGINMLHIPRTCSEVGRSQSDEGELTLLLLLWIDWI